MAKTIDFEELYEACLRNDWFNAGSNAQYSKFFDLNHEGASIEELALAIWLCTEDIEREKVLHQLRSLMPAVPDEPTSNIERI